MKEASKEWLDLADSDLQMVDAALERKLYGQAVFHSQQAVEKALKAIWAERRDELPPRTHNLADLAAELKMLTADEEFLRRLSNAAVAGRYAGAVSYSEDMAVQYQRKTKELCGRLRRSLT